MAMPGPIDDCRVAVPLTGWTAAGIYRRHARPASGQSADGDPARDGAGALVGAGAPQSDCVATQGGAVVPARRRGRRRALPPAATPHRATPRPCGVVEATWDDKLAVQAREAAPPPTRRPPHWLRLLFVLGLDGLGFGWALLVRTQH